MRFKIISRIMITKVKPVNINKLIRGIVVKLALVPMLGLIIVSMLV